MSYCRFSECDAYIYDSVSGVQFYVARSVGDDLDRLCPTYNEAYLYAKNLRDKHGVDIPDHAIYALREEALEEAERISGPMSAVAELRAEVERLKRDEWGEGFNAGCDAVNAAIEDGVEYYKGEISRLASENAELREQVERLHADQAHWELGNCPSCPNIVSLQEALEQNAKLRKFAARMASALGINREWCDTSWCDVDCMVEFGCQPVYCGGETRCPAWARLRELGIGVGDG